MPAHNQRRGPAVSAQRRHPSRPSTPRRRPSRAVYARRRAIVFGTPIVVVLAIALLLVGGHHSKTPTATLAANASEPSPTPAGTETATTPAQPASAACTPSSIQVTPSVTNGVAGSPIQIDLTLTTTEPACTFAMSGNNVAVRVDSGTNALWTSQNCSNVVPTGTVSLAKAAPITVSMSWDGHQSNGTCGATNPWVGPGTYQVMASVIGATPTTSSFTLALPGAPTVTETASPTAAASPKASESPKSGTPTSASPKK